MAALGELSPKSRADQAAERRSRLLRKKRLAGTMKLPSAELRKDAGNDAFQNGDFEMAVIQYTKALQLLTDEDVAQAAEKEAQDQQQAEKCNDGSAAAVTEDAATEPVKPDRGAAAAKKNKKKTKRSTTDADADDRLRAALYSNRSAAYAKLSELEFAVRDGQLAVLHHPRFLKAHARKGSALFQMGRTKEAREAYQYGLEFCCGDSEGDAAAAAALQNGIDECDNLLNMPLRYCRDRNPYGATCGSA
ncbi:unnamed protein product [Amoebophrya sp. A25]|nr:unnamed protein product [Amoebophrya sp. A25]|eukprot:GSA25T00020279001.1